MVENINIKSSTQLKTFTLIHKNKNDNKVFDYIRKCDPNFAGRGELEITEVNNFYIKEKKLSWEELNGYWSDAGTFDSLFKASNYWATQKK